MPQNPYFPQMMPPLSIFGNPLDRPNYATAIPIGEMPAALGITGVTSNANGEFPLQLPANAYILSAFFRNTTANAVSVAIGTTEGGSDVMSAQPVPPNGTLTVNPFESPNWFSATLPKSLWASSASWGLASVNILLAYQNGL